jgi:hypothetical protein
MSAPIDYLAGYPADFRAQAASLKASGVLLERLEARYTTPHDVQGNAQLYAYVQDLKRTWMKSSPPLGKVRYSDKISTLHRAFGLHTYAVRVQGAKLKRKNELRVASVFKELSEEFLRMVVVHELAHLRHKDHDKAFYRLCQHMEPDYLRYETDLRLLLYARQGDPR